MMRISLRQTKSLKRYLVYTTDNLRMRPIDPTRFYTPAPHQNRRFADPVEKVGLARTRGIQPLTQIAAGSGFYLCACDPRSATVPSACEREESGILRRHWIPACAG